MALSSSRSSRTGSSRRRSTTGGGGAENSKLDDDRNNAPTDGFASRHKESDQQKTLRPSVSASDDESLTVSTQGESSNLEGSDSPSRRKGTSTIFRSTGSSRSRRSQVNLDDFLSKAEGADQLVPRSTQSLVDFVGASADSASPRSPDSRSSMNLARRRTSSNRGDVMERLHSSASALSFDEVCGSPTRPKGMGKRMRKRLSERKLQPPNLDKTVDSTPASPRIHLTMNNLSSISETAKGSALEPRQPSDGQLSTRSKKEEGEDSAVVASLQGHSSESTETNRRLNMKIEQQSKELAEKELQIQKPVSNDKDAVHMSKTGEDKIKTGEKKEEEGEKEIESGQKDLKEELNQMKVMLQKYEAAESEWKLRLERAEGKQSKPGGSNEKEADHQPEPPNDDSESKVVDQLSTTVKQLTQKLENIEEDWKHKLEASQKEAASLAAKLEEAKQRNSQLENQARSPGIPSAPTSSTKSTLPLGGTVVKAKRSSLRRSRHDRESYLRKAFAPRDSEKDCNESIDLSHTTSTTVPAWENELQEDQLAFEESASQVSDISESTLQSRRLSLDGRNSPRKLMKLHNETKVLRLALLAKDNETDELRRFVSKLQDKQIAMRQEAEKNLQEKEEEIKALRQTVTRLQDAEWSLREDVTGYKEQYESTLVDSLSSKQKLSGLEDYVEKLQSRVEELEKAREREEKLRKAQWDMKLAKLEDRSSDPDFVKTDQDKEGQSKSAATASSQAALLEQALARKRSTVSPSSQAAALEAAVVKRSNVSSAGSSRHGWGLRPFRKSAN